MICPLTNAFIGLIGVLIGGLIGHWLVGVRDIAARKCAFQAFLSKWKAEISAPDRSPTIATAKPDRAIVAYDSRLPSFCAEVKRANGVFKDSKRFEVLTGRLESLKAEDWQNNQPRDVILEAIDELIKFAA